MEAAERRIAQWMSREVEAGARSQREKHEEEPVESKNFEDMPDDEDEMNEVFGALDEAIDEAVAGQREATPDAAYEPTSPAESSRAESLTEDAAEGGVYAVRNSISSSIPSISPTPRGLGPGCCNFAQSKRSKISSQRSKDREEKFLLQMARDLGGDAPQIVSEIYSPPRVTGAARRLKSLGLTAGFAFDLTSTDENGVPWDFSVAARRREARRRLSEQKPMFLIGSPMCTVFSTLQSMNAQVRDPNVVHREYSKP